MLIAKNLKGFKFPSVSGPFTFGTSRRNFGIWCTERGAFIQIVGATGPRMEQPYVPCGGRAACLEVAAAIDIKDTFAVPHIQD